MKPTQPHILMMLEESNKIEQVYDHRSLMDAKKAWKFINQFDSLNGMIIRETHKILMTHQDIDYRDKGEWRRVPVQIGYQIKSQPPLVINSQIQDLVKKINEFNYDPVQLHVEFENIHPFIDGNGRIGRIIMNWQSVQQFDQLIVFFDQKKQEYYRLFR